MLKVVLRLTCAAALLLPVSVAAKRDPVEWTASLRQPPVRGAAVVAVRARIERGWFMYGMQQPADGPAPLRFRLAPGSSATLGAVKAPTVRTTYDRGFRARVGKYIGTQEFLVPVTLGRASDRLGLEIRYQACNDTVCLPPRTTTLQVVLSLAKR